MIVIEDKNTGESFTYKENKTGKAAANKKYQQLMKKNGSLNVRVVYGLPEVNK